MLFKAIYLSLSVAEREEFARSVDTSVGMLNLVAYGHRKIELGFADVLVAMGHGKYRLEDLPLTERAKKQSLMRSRVNEVDQTAIEIKRLAE